MSLSIWTKASKAFSIGSTTTLRSAAPVSRRSFAFLSRHNVVVPSATRVQSRSDSSAAALEEAIAKEDAFRDPGAPATPADAPVVVKKTGLRFDSLAGKISKETLDAITVKPFKLTHMTSVQEEVLPLLPELAEPLESHQVGSHTGTLARDLLVRAKTGTGKTLAFLVPAIEARIKAVDAAGKKAVKDAGQESDPTLEAKARTRFARDTVGTLIISPTRELATQIANEALRLSHHHKGFEVRLFTGGMSKGRQMRDWMTGRRDIVVATPGRLRDLLTTESEVKRGISYTQVLVLDEADTLLDMGFRDDIEAIKDCLPPTPQRQTFLFSATVSPAIRQIALSTLDKRHIFIDTVTEEDSPVHAHVDQYSTTLPSAGHQIPYVMRLLAHDQLINPGTSKTVVFLPTTKMTQLFTTIVRGLSRQILPAGKNTTVYEIHSKRTQESRTKTSDMFRRHNHGNSILITSDVSARGVDYPGVTRVIQVGIPSSTEQYIHRVGRTGRAGTKGRGDLVLLPWEIGFLTWQLTEVPLKPLTLNELKAQLSDMSAKFDNSPAEFFADSPKTPRDTRSRLQVGKDAFQHPFTPVHDEFENAVAALLNQLDEEAIRETFLSLLGYYIAKTPELRVQKGVVLEGIRQWATDATGLPEPPYVSEAFLHKLGASDGRTKRFGQRAPPMDGFRGRSSHSGPSWGGRGKQSTRFNERPQASEPADDGRYNDDASEYKSTRYGADSRSGGGYQRKSFGSEGGYQKRSFGDRDGGYQKKSFGDRDGGFKSFGDRDGGFQKKSYGDRDGGFQKKSYGDRDGGFQKKSYGDRDGGFQKRSFGDRDGGYQKRYGQKSYGSRDGGD